MTKTISVCLALLLLPAVLLSGCGLQLPFSGDDTTSQAPAPSGGQTEFVASEIDRLKVAYNNTDSLSPYQLTSIINQNISTLIYDPLVKLDRNFAPRRVIAREVTLTPEQCVVTLQGGLRFSNGDPLTSKDVLYSARQVLTPGNNFYGMLSGVSDIKAPDDFTVVFSLIEPDHMFERLLTFPIVNAENPELGSGRYLLQNSVNHKKLVVNGNWYGTNNSQIKEIELVNQIDKETLIYSLKLGIIDYVYSDLAENESSSLSGSTQSVPLNNMVYLGVNSTKRLLSSKNVRQAISLSLDRTGLVGETYGSRALPARAPFHPSLAEVVRLNLPLTQDFEAAAALLEEAGYKSENKDSAGYYVTGQGRLRLRLLVSSDNSAKKQLALALQKNFEEFGIELVIDERPFTDYKAALAAWDFDLYLGEVKLYNNMNLSTMITASEGLGFGVTESDVLMGTYYALRVGTMDYIDFMTAFEAETPFIPLMYRSGMVSFSREVFFDSPATETDIFYNIENW